MRNPKNIGFTFLVSVSFCLTIINTSAIAKKVDSGISFTNQSAKLNTFERVQGEGLSGAAWFDYDKDGDLDLFIPNGKGAENGLFKNIGNGLFANVTIESGLDDSIGYSGVVAGDIDNDGFPDLYLSGVGGLFGISSQNSLYHNNGDGTFSNISSTSNTPGSESDSAVLMADYNNDGLVDIFVAGYGHFNTPEIPFSIGKNSLYINNGDLTFSDISSTAGIDKLYGARAAISFDHNNDGWMDILVSNSNDGVGTLLPFQLYLNNKDGTFTDIASQVGLDIGGFWMGFALGDYDNDGDLDIFAANGGGFLPHALLQRNENGSYSNVTPPELALTEFVWGCSFADWDNDGFVDLFYTGSWAQFGVIGSNLGNPGHLFFNNRQGGFNENFTSLGINLESLQTSGVARADYNNDGFMDLVVATEAFKRADPDSGNYLINASGAPVLLENKGNSNHWFTVRLEGVQSNRMGIGARLTLLTPFGKQVRVVLAGSSFQSSETPWPTFGLGKAKTGLLIVKWPSGIEESFKVKADQIRTFVEGDGKNLLH